MAINPSLAFGTLTSGVRTNSTVPKPSGTVDGDFLLSVIVVQPDVTVTLPAGWTLIVSDLDAGDRVSRTVVAYKRASGEGSDWTWNHASSTSSGAVWRLTGVVASGNPEDATRSVAHADAPTFTWTSITTATANSLVVGIMGKRSATSTSSATSLTERLDHPKIMIMADVQASAGASGAKTAAESDANDSTMILLALKEEAGSTNTTISPSAGAIALAGVAALVTQSGATVISPQTGSLTLAGFAVTQDLNVPAPITGSLALSGVAPSLTHGIARTPSVASLSISGIAPSVTQQFRIAPSVGALALAGSAPTVSGFGASASITPAAGLLSFSSSQPTLTLSSPVIRPGTGAMVLTGVAPTASSFVFIPAGFISGTAVDEDGVMGTDFLAEGVNVPAGALMLGGFAHSAAGLRYVAPWPAAGQVFYENGVARRPDGAMCVIASGTVHSFKSGWAVTDRGEVIASAQAPELVHNGIGQRQDGSVCMSEIA